MESRHQTFLMSLKFGHSKASPMARFESGTSVLLGTVFVFLTIQHQGGHKETENMLKCSLRECANY